MRFLNTRVLGGQTLADPKVIGSVSRLEASAKELLGWAEANPMECGLAGLDFPAWSLGQYLSHGLCKRAMSGRMSASDLEHLSKMGEVVSIGHARLSRYVSVAEHESVASSMGDFATVATLGAAVIGLVSALL